MRAASLFSGCGGLDLGATRAGAELMFATDIDPGAEHAYKSLLPEVEFQQCPIAGVDSLPEVDLLLGAYPCQAFSDGGLRRPEDDPRAQLFSEFGRLLASANPPYFLVENVPGLRRLRGGRLLREQLESFSDAGEHGYEIAVRMLRAERYGVAQRRRRIFAVGVRRDLGRHFWFPPETHGGDGQEPAPSHGDAIRELPLWPAGEYYEHPNEDHNFPWYYLSRNRKAPWDEPGLTVLASWRHVSLHPASPAMERVRDDPRDDRNRQTWRFSQTYEHLEADESRPVLERPRRLSARECARLQGLPDELALDDDRRAAFRHIGNAVPPRLGEAVVGAITGGSGLRKKPSSDRFIPRAGATARRLARAA
jgi:DNA (cytosine-5)-methyltransferase 1